MRNYRIGNYMIETEETRAEFEQRRERARSAMKCAIRGELAFSSENKEPLEETTRGTDDSKRVITDDVVITNTEAYETGVITVNDKLCPRCKEIQRLRTQRSRKKKD